MTTSPISQFEMLKESVSPDIVTEYAFIEHTIYEEPECLLKSFTKQLSITCQLNLDEVSVDGVDGDNHAENENCTQMYAHGCNWTTSVNEPQEINTAELLERGPPKQNFNPGRGTPITAHICESEAEQTAQTSGLSYSSSVPYHRVAGPAHLVPRFPHASLGTRIPIELHSVPNSHNQVFLRMISPATCFNPSLIPADTPNLYYRTGRPPGHIGSSLESSSASATASSSSSSFLISGTDGELLITKRIQQTKDGQMHRKNEQPQVTYADTWKRSQMNTHAGIKACSNFSRQHLIQSQQQNLHVTNIHAQQYDYIDGNPCIYQHGMLDSSLYPQRNYQSSSTQRPDFNKLSTFRDTKQAFSIAQIPSIPHEIECPQKYYPLQVNHHCNISGLCKCLKENSCDFPRGPQLHQTNQQKCSNQSISSEKISQINAFPSKCTSSSSVAPSQNRRVQSSDVENRCLEQNPHFMHGEYQHSLNHELVSNHRLHLRHRNSEFPLQSPSEGKQDFLGHSSAEITEGQAAETNKTGHLRAAPCKPQIEPRMDKCAEWLYASNNEIIGANVWPNNYKNHAEKLKPNDNNNHNAYDRQRTKQASEHCELIARNVPVLTEHSLLPRGLFTGNPIPESQKQKSTLTKKHSPHNSCPKETVPKKGNMKQSSSKEVQKNKTQSADRNYSYNSSIQFQHYNCTDSCNGYIPEIPANGLCTDKTIDKISQKQLTKYKYSVSNYCRLSQTNIQKADTAIDEEIKLLDEKSLKENMWRSSSSSDRKNVGKTSRQCIDGTNCLTVTPSHDCNKGIMPQTLDQHQHSYRQVNCEPVCTTDSDKECRMKHGSQKENGVLVSRGKKQMLRNKKDTQTLQENADPKCLKQINHKYCDDNIKKFGMNNLFNCESPQPNSLNPDINSDQQNTEHDRTTDYRQEVKNSNNPSDVSYYASNCQNIGKDPQKITENQSSSGNLQNQALSSYYTNSTSVDNVTGSQFVDDTQKHHSHKSGSQNACYSQSNTHRFDSAGFPISELSNKCREYNSASPPNRSSVFAEYTQNPHSNKFMPPRILQNCYRDQRPGLSYTAQAYGPQLISSAQSTAHQHSCIVPPSSNQSGGISTTRDACSVPPSSQTTLLMTRLQCPSVSSPSLPQSFQDPHFKIPYSVDQNRNGSNLHYNESLQATPCYSSIDTNSDASMCSDNSASRSRASENAHSYQQNRVHKDTVPTSYQSPLQGLQFIHQLQHNYNSQHPFENKTYTDTLQQQQIQSSLPQKDQQIGSQDKIDFQSCSSKGRMHLPCFLQSADSDDHVVSCRSSAPQSISPHLLNQIPCYQRAPSTQSENLESIMTSISEKSLMSTGTSDDCYLDKTNSSEQHTKDTAEADIQQGSRNTANVIHNQTTPNNSKTEPSLQQASCSSYIVTNRDTNMHRSPASQFVDAALGVFPPLNFEDCRDAMPLSLSSSTDMEPLQTLTKPHQVLVNDGGQGNFAGPSELKLISCQHRSVEAVPCISSGVGNSSSACEGDSQVLVRPGLESPAAGADNLSDLSFLSRLEDDLNVENKNQRIKDILQDLNQ